MVRNVKGGVFRRGRDTLSYSRAGRVELCENRAALRSAGRRTPGDRLVQARVRGGAGPRLRPGSRGAAATPVGARMVASAGAIHLRGSWGLRRFRRLFRRVV